MSEFTDSLSRAGLLGEPSVQQQAIDQLKREYQADEVTWFTRLDGSGDRVARFWRCDETEPVGRAVVTPAGQVQTDVTEDIG